MPYLFTDDGSPEACEYADNYRWFDSDSLPALLQELRGRRQTPSAPRRSAQALSSSAGDSYFRLPSPKSSQDNRVAE